MNRHFIAVDLGASNGRVVLGTLADGRLTLVEAHRFENAPVREGGSLRWDLSALEREIRAGIAKARRRLRGGRLHALGVDSWGVDYVLMDESGRPVARPFHYRDRRTEGAFERVPARIGREAIFRRSGVQFMPFNTLYQLASERPGALGRAAGMLLIADWFAHRLGGRPLGEVTLGSTTQLVNPRTRDWSPSLVADIFPGGALAPLLPDLVEAGTITGEHEGAPVVLSASHDTAAAVAGCPGKGDDWAFLSSGTWSLLGVELPAPVVTEAALDANLSNELGVAGTTRLLKNIMGLWPLQQCREAWAAAGRKYSWEAITRSAEKARPLGAVIDPDDPRFFAPGDMPARITAFCRETKQAPPEGVGATARAILEGLALKCRLVLESLERVTGRRLRVINMVGGGTRNRLLCQWTADACARPVVAGPVEATAAGNVMVQARAVGAVRDLAAAREVIRRSFAPVTYDPRPSAAWDDACARLRTILKG